MKTKHTPGPWSRTTAGTFDKPKILAKVDKDYLTIAVCDSSTWRYHFMRMGDNENARKFGGNADEANAKLMAAAPEMLIELKNALDGFKILSGAYPDHSGIKNDIQRIETIIKKATE